MKPATQKQIDYILGLFKDRGVTETTVSQCHAIYGALPTQKGMPVAEWLKTIDTKHADRIIKALLKTTSDPSGW